jgi:hypothetical protein
VALERVIAGKREVPIRLRLYRTENISRAVVLVFAVAQRSAPRFGLQRHRLLIRTHSLNRIAGMLMRAGTSSATSLA